MTCPYPPRVLVADRFLDQMRQQLFSVRYRYMPDPLFPGWTFKDTTHVDQTVLRYDTADGFWLWELTGNRTDDGYYQSAEWRD